MKPILSILYFTFIVTICQGAGSQEPPLAYPNCGLYALAAIGGALGNPLSCETLAKDSPHLSSSLVSIDDILKAAEKAGIPLTALRGDNVEALLQVPPPYIIGLRSNHLVAVLGNEGGSLQILDQTGEKKSLTPDDLSKEWSGELLRPGKSVLTPESLPMVHVLTHTIHLGLLETMEPRMARFVLYNYANEAVQLRIVEKSCGCIDPTFKPNLIAPGESSVIEAVFTPKESIHDNQKESFVVEWSLDDRSNAGRETFEIEAVVKKPFQFSPVVLQGEIYRGKWTMGSLLTCLNSDDELADRWKIAAARWTTPPIGDIVVSATSIEILPPNELPVGEWHGFLSIDVKTVDEKKERTVSLPVHLQVISDIAVSPNVLDFGFVGDRSQAERMLTFKDAKGRDLQIVEIPPELEIVQEKTNDTPKNSITARINPQLREKVLAKECLFVVQADGKPERIKIRIQAVLN